MSTQLAYIEQGLCPRCGDLTENTQVCTACGYVSGSKTGEEDDPVMSNGTRCGLCGADEPLDEFCDVLRCADVLACLDCRSQPRASGGSGG